MKAELTPKKKIFVDEYLIDFNATQAAIKAGYSKKTARSQGQRLLTNVDIQEAIQKAMKERSERTEITQDMVLKELATFGFANIQDYIKHSQDGLIIFKSIDDIPEGAARAIEAIKVIDNGSKGSVEFKLHSKSRGLELIGRHLGMFLDKVNLTGDFNVDKPILLKVVETHIEDQSKEKNGNSNSPDKT